MGVWWCLHGGAGSRGDGGGGGCGMVAGLLMVMVVLLLRMEMMLLMKATTTTTTTTTMLCPRSFRPLGIIGMRSLRRFACLGDRRGRVVEGAVKRTKEKLVGMVLGAWARHGSSRMLLLLLSKATRLRRRYGLRPSHSTFVEIRGSSLASETISGMEPRGNELLLLLLLLLLEMLTTGIVSAALRGSSELELQQQQQGICPSVDLIGT